MLRAAATTYGLLATSAILVHLTHGLIEAHFHFFVMLIVVAVYHDWLAFLLCAVVVVVEHAVVERSIVWANTRVCQEAVVRRAILGRQCHVGRSALVEDGAVLGDKSVVTDYSRL